MRIFHGMPEESSNTLWNELADCEARGLPHVLVMLLETRGSAPQSAGAKMLVRENGLPFGTVGGGKIEAAAIRFARELLSADGPGLELREV
ncbi:MAG: XdhC family protein, partial [Verrucomicrobiota bacterium]